MTSHQNHAHANTAAARAACRKAMASVKPGAAAKIAAATTKPKVAPLMQRQLDRDAAATAKRTIKLPEPDVTVILPKTATTFTPSANEGRTPTNPDCQHGLRFAAQACTACKEN